MAVGRGRVFPCGHRGRGQYCHLCEQRARAREQQAARHPVVSSTPRGVPNLHEALTLATKLGCEVSTVRRTGEVLVHHASLGRRVRINNRRKDAPRALLTFLAQLDPNRSS